MSKVIYNPKLAKVEEFSSTSASFVIEPTQAGYGDTLGNSLRRVLLSSIRGGAITAFRVEGVSHEFTTVPGVKEDVVDIMLNLKNVRVKVHSDNPVELRLEKKGAGAVKASDIKANGEVEIVNPDQIIATIDDPKKTLAIDLVVEAGRGYQAIEESTDKRLHGDMIALDALFSPVLRVRYKVDNTRVGQDTNLNKLTINVETDGTVSPSDAFEEAAAILVNQYTALAGATTAPSAPAPGTEGSDGEFSDSVSIEELGLSPRTANALMNNGIATITDLLNLSETALRDLKGFGSKALDEVKEKLAELKI